jgi:perosamine synthetase
VDKIPWFGPVVGEAEAEALRQVVASGYLNDGPVTRAFEEEVAAFLGVRHAVAVTSGTVALSLSLMALGIGPGDEVIVPDLTFIATANAVRMTGADVRLVDVEPWRFTIDLAAAEAAIGPRTRAIIPVDVNGRAPDYAALEALCMARGLHLVCDAAEGLGSRCSGRYLGTFGQAGCFSFSANKTVTSGQGGMIVTDDDALHNRLRELKDQGRRHGGTGGDDLHPTLGFNFKYTNLQAAVARVQFAGLETRLEAMRRRDRLYRDHLGGLDGLTLPPERSNDGEVRQWFDIVSDRRDEIIAALDAIAAGSRAFWFPLHRQEPYRLEDAGFTGAIAASDRGLWLPSHLEITPEQIERVGDVIRRTLAQKD